MKRGTMVFLTLWLLGPQAKAAQSSEKSHADTRAIQVAQVTGASAQTPAPEAASIQSRGFWMETHMGLNLRTLASTGPDLGSGLVLGYKLQKLVVGLGLDLTYAWDKNSTNNTTETDQTLSLALGPVVEFLLAQFGPAGFFVTGAGKFLFTWHKEKQSMGQLSVEQKDKTYGFDLKAGAGGRYYFGGRVGLGLELGMLFLYTKNGDNKTFGFGPYSMLTLATIW